MTTRVLTPSEALHGRGSTVVTTALAVGTRAAVDAETRWLIDRFVRHGHRHPDYWHFTKQATGREVLYRVHNLQDHPVPACHALLAPDGPLVGVAQGLLGAPVLWTAFAMVVKMPSVAAPVPWHRDRVDVPAGAALNLSVFLDDCDVTNGCLQTVPGSHLLPDESDVTNVVEHGPVVDVEARAGDIVAHDVRLVHGSRENTSVRMRRSLCVEFSTQDGMPRG